METDAQKETDNIENKKPNDTTPNGTLAKEESGDNGEIKSDFDNGQAMRLLYTLLQDFFRDFINALQLVSLFFFFCIPVIWVGIFLVDHLLKIDQNISPCHVKEKILLVLLII